MASAALVAWDVDPSVSYVRLTVPDQVVPVPDIGNVTVRMRDANNNNDWTDAGGRRAAVDGIVVTEYEDSSTIAFTSGAHDLYALEETSLRPNPSDWDAATTNYVGTSTAPAAFGARVRGTYVFNFDAAYLALRQVQLNIASGVLPVAAGSFDGTQTQFGISSASSYVDGLSILGLGQPVPDLFDEPLPPVVGTNSAAGTIEDLGGRNRKLTYNINVPVSIQVEDITLTGSAAGQIVAYATLPETAPLEIVDPGIRTNEFGFTITGTSDLVVVVEAATALANPTWLPIGTNTLSGGTSYFSDPQWTDHPSRFYRVRPQ